MGRRPVSWHPEVFTPSTRRAFEAIAAQAFLKDFYLAGGTGLAVQFGHRVSVDLDLFTRTRPLDRDDRRMILKQLGKGPAVSLIEEREGTLHVELSDVRVSLLHYDYPLLYPPKRWRGVAVASPMDIGLMKIGAIIGRGSRKDFIDLYLIGKRVSPLESLLKKAARKFPHIRDFRIQALKALVYFQDAERERMPRMLQDIPWAIVRAYFENEVRKIISRVLK
jgi:hypothetical protein